MEQRLFLLVNVYTGFYLLTTVVTSIFTSTTDVFNCVLVIRCDRQQDYSKKKTDGDFRPFYTAPVRSVILRLSIKNVQFCC